MRLDKKLDPVLSHLRANSTLFLATVGSDGAPRSTPLFFIPDQDLNLYWFSSRHCLHSRNCSLFPEVSVAVSGSARTWEKIQGVQMQGRVSIVADRVLRKSITANYVERFKLGNLFSLAIRRSSLYCFTPDWVRYIDNSRRFGYKFELALNKSKSATSLQHSSAGHQ